jgi:hypothetical protein
MALLFLFFGSCKKSDDTVANSRYQLIKVLDDKISEIQNSNYMLAAGSDRYYLIYQVDLLNETRSVLVVTDRSGTVVNRDTLPSGINISDVTVLDDGSAWVAGYLFCCPNVYVFHYDQDAIRLALYNVYIPGIDLLSLYGGPRLGQSLNGNVIIFGNYFSSSGFTPYGYMAEADQEGNVLWSKKLSEPISSCTATTDNGYLVASYVSDTTGGIDIYLVKTNATGDSLRANKIREHAVQAGIGNIVRTAGNTYQVDYWEEQPSYVNTIVEANGNGDVLNSRSFDNARSGQLISRNDGRTVLLLPPYAFSSSNAVTVRKSTVFITVDASLHLLERFDFQDVTTDYILSACNTPEGKVACFGVIQPQGGDYYKPVLIVLE